MNNNTRNEHRNFSPMRKRPLKKGLLEFSRKGLFLSNGEQVYTKIAARAAILHILARERVPKKITPCPSWCSTCGDMSDNAT